MGHEGIVSKGDVPQFDRREIAVSNGDVSWTIFVSGGIPLYPRLGYDPFSLAGGMQMADETPPPDWGKVAPVYSNFFVITASPAAVRISFGEGFGPGVAAVYHAAVAMHPQDAVTLAQTILNMLQKHPQVQTHESRPEESEDGHA